AFREGLARLRVDASGLVDEYDHDEQQDGSELAGDRRQRDTADPNSACSGHRADPVRRWREDTAWMARAGERARKSARNVKSRLLCVRDGRSEGLRMLRIHFY